MRRAFVFASFFLLGVSASVHADEKLFGVACRSVHLAYKAPQGTEFINSVVVEQSAPGTYFCVCGFNKGYFGIQELGNGKKLVIFSVWDPGQQNDPRNVDEDRRVKLISKDAKTRVGRFGNEGTGGQSFYDLDWKNGEVYSFAVKAKVAGERTEYSAFFKRPDDKEWTHMATFSTIAQGKALSGYYAFVEDFKRDRVSATKIRKASYHDGWVKTLDGSWQPLTEARFTGDGNPATNIDSGVRENQFFLATGGATRNVGTKLNDWNKRDETRKNPTSMP
jgi:hypothetical protein